jgi:hypothetical protein
MERKTQNEQVETIPGWVCAAIGIGFVLLLIIAIVVVRTFGS